MVDDPFAREEPRAATSRRGSQESTLVLADVSSPPLASSETEDKEAEFSDEDDATGQLDEDVTIALAVLRSDRSSLEEDEVPPRPSTSTFASSLSVYSTATAAYPKSRASSEEEQEEEAPPRPSTSTMASSLSAYSTLTTDPLRRNENRSPVAASPASLYFSTSSQLAQKTPMPTQDRFRMSSSAYGGSSGSSGGEGDAGYTTADEWTKVSAPSTPILSSSNNLAIPTPRPLKLKRNSSDKSSSSRNVGAGVRSSIAARWRSIAKRAVATHRGDQPEIAGMFIILDRSN